MWAGVSFDCKSKVKYQNLPLKKGVKNISSFFVSYGVAYEVKKEVNMEHKCWSSSNTRVYASI